MDESAKIYMTHAENDLIVAETMSGDSEAHTGTAPSILNRPPRRP